MLNGNDEDPANEMHLTPVNHLDKVSATINILSLQIHYRAPSIALRQQLTYL